ncbi:hypothetical protein JB92DRAFT_3129218 [Gautieria morchelliformis]|nr:hypothetical protein JB92DRAFT_3129218 [Gautieria morchelliformis]
MDPGLLERSGNKCIAISELKDAGIVEITTWCWLSVSSIELRSKAAIALADVLEQPQSTRVDLDRVIASAGTVERLINTFHGVFQDTDVGDEYMANSMSLLTGFTGQTVHVDLARWFAKMKTHHEVMAALRRQLTHPKSGEEAWRVLEYSNDAAFPTEELTNLIALHSLIPLLGVHHCGVRKHLDRRHPGRPS